MIELPVAAAVRRARSGPKPAQPKITTSLAIAAVVSTSACSTFSCSRASTGISMARMSTHLSP